MANFFEKKNNLIFECVSCDFKCCKKGDWNRHLLTLKHKRLITANILHHGKEENCENSCNHKMLSTDFILPQKTENILHHGINFEDKNNKVTNDTSNSKPKKNSVRSILHHGINFDDDIKTVSNQTTKRKTKKNTVTSILHHSIKCENCGKIYKHHSSLCKHRKRCFSANMINTEESTKEPEIKELINRNNELMEKLIEVSGEKSTTNTFNLNVFLNETCKDALNISDFIASLQIHLSDLNHLKDCGFSEGLSNIIVKELKDIDVSKRPLHCCDSKKDIIYIKEKYVWEPDNQNNDKMKNAIQLVANKCVQNIKTWENNNPKFLEFGTTDNDNYNVLIKNSLGSKEAKTKEKELNRIVKTVTNQIQLDKNKIDTIKS